MTSSDDLDILLSSSNEEELQSFLNLLQRDELLGLVQELSFQYAHKIFPCLHPSDVAFLLVKLPSEEWDTILKQLNREQLPSLLTELEDPELLHILEHIHEQQLPQLLREMESDDAADILGVLPLETARRVLGLMEPDEARRLRRLLQYPSDTAGGLMQTEMVRVSHDATVQEAIQEVRRLVENSESELDIFEIFVVNEMEQLEGNVSLGRLILARSQTPIAELVDAEVYWVPVDMDQEEVASYIQQYNLVSLPVVDHNRVLLGRITVDDIVDVMEEEASDDIFQMAGVAGDDVVYDRTLRSAMLRLPWLITNLFGGLLTGFLMLSFKGSLSEKLMVVLVAFVPVITGMGGNVGTQSSSITVRGFAIGRIDLANYSRYLFKEMRVGALMGLVCGSSLSVVGWIWHGHPSLGIVVGLALFCAMTVAASMGAIFPAIFQWLKVDPALASGPFVTTFNDVTGIVIYFSMALGFRSWLL